MAITREPYVYSNNNPLTWTDPSGRDDINTIPASVHYTGPTADCLYGPNTYNIEALRGESPQHACSRAFPGSAELNTCQITGCYGGSGENTNGAITPQDVNNGSNIEHPLIVDEPEPLGLKVFSACLSAALTLAMPVAGAVGLVEIPWASRDWG